MLPELLACLLECLLNNFLRIRIILNQPIRYVIRGIQMRQEKFFKLGLLIRMHSKSNRLSAIRPAGCNISFGCRR
jgi:hypothetical protein